MYIENHRVLILDIDDQGMESSRILWRASELEEEVLFAVVENGNWPRETVDFEPDIIVADFTLPHMAQFVYRCFVYHGLASEGVIANDLVSMGLFISGQIKITDKSLKSDSVPFSFWIKGNMMRSFIELRSFVDLALDRPF